MFGLEELTKEELIGWIRENNPEMDEVVVVMQTLRQRVAYATEKASGFFDRHKEASSKVDEVIKPYIPAGAKSGTKINVPADVVRQYEALTKDREDLWTEYSAWSDLGMDASKKISELADYLVERKQKQSGGK